MSEYTEANRRLWDEWTEIHEGSQFYDVEGFKAGRDTLWPFESEWVGDVHGKSLLHLQCHFGMDTLSWARRGARVIGADFSPKAIKLARSLAAELGIDATFVCSDVLSLDQTLEGEFDIVYTGRGAIVWLGDLTRWGRIISHFLRPGGVFLIHEFHPFPFVFDDHELVPRFPYFPRASPLEFPVQGSYADRDALVSQKVEYAWPHSMAEIFTSLMDAGLRIERFEESAGTRENLFEWTVQNDDGFWHAPNDSVPLMYAILARKEPAPAGAPQPSASASRKQSAQRRRR